MWMRKALLTSCLSVQRGFLISDGHKYQSHEMTDGMKAIKSESSDYDSPKACL